MNHEKAEARARHFVRRGLAEGYPPCCVVWFAFVWTRIHSNVAYRAAIARYNHLIDLVGRRPGYIPCPACLLERLRAKQTPAPAER